MRSRTVPALVLLAAVALQAVPAAAQLKVGGGGVEVAGPNNTAAVQPVAGDAGTMTVREMRRQGGQTLRCWQNGRLLYEGSGFRGGVGGASAISVPRRSEGDPVVVLNLQHAICILSDN